MLKKAQDQTRLAKAIEELENAIIGGDPETEKYTNMVSNLVTLYELRDGKKPTQTEFRDWIPVIGSTVGIVVIAVFEAHGHSIVSKGLSLLPKLKS